MTMHKPFIIIVTGAPCTGKTTLAQWLADQLHLPLLCKDAIKELLFDELGWSDRAWSRKLGKASITLLFSLIEVQLRAGQSFIAESNFMHPWGTENFLRLQPGIKGKILCRRIRSYHPNRSIKANLLYITHLSNTGNYGATRVRQASMRTVLPPLGENKITGASDGREAEPDYTLTRRCEETQNDHTNEN